MNTRPSWPSWRQTQQTQQTQGITKLCMALLLACCLLLTFPGSSSAHAVLVRSDPTQGAVLRAPPGQVRLWFSEDLNPSLSTAQVLDGANQRRVDSHDAHRSPGETLEMDVSLEPHLPPAVYVVIWRTVSNVDGHVLGGSFLFTVSRPDGSIPSLSEGRISGQTGQTGQTAPGTSAFSGSSRGQLDGVTLFNLLMVTLVELGAVFWVGAQFWLLLVLQPAAEDHAELTALHQQAQLRFERRFSLPTLLALLLANGGVLIGQAVTLTGGNVSAAFAFSVLFSLLSSGGFGAYWIMRVLTLSLLLALALYRVQHRVQRKAPSRQTTVFSWTQVLLGLILFIAMTMSSHAAAAGPSTRVYAAVADWLHLVAAALWVGGMLSIATCYVPVLRHRPVAERAHALVTVLPYSSLWAVVGVLLMAVTGPLSATVELSSWEQFLITAYGRVLVVKILLVGAMLLTSAFHVFLLRPRLQKEEMKYASASVHLPSSETETVPNRFTESRIRQVKLREGRLGRLAALTQRLTTVLRYEPMLGVAVLICVGLLNVFAGTLAPSAVPTAKASPSTPTASWQTTARTSDERFTFTLTVNPKQAGPNTFTVSVVDNRTGKPTTQVGISLYTKYLEKDLGTATVNLQPDGKGHFSASGDLALGGHWQIRVQIRTVQNTLHEATVTFVTS